MGWAEQLGAGWEAGPACYTEAKHSGRLSSEATEMAEQVSAESSCVCGWLLAEFGKVLQQRAALREEGAGFEAETREKNKIAGICNNEGVKKPTALGHK